MQLSDFETYIKRDFKRTDKDTEIIRALNDMIVWVSQQMPVGNYKYQSYVHTVDGQEDYALPSNLIHLIHPIRLLEGTGSNDWGYPMTRLTKEEYDILYPNPNRTSPTDKSKPINYVVYSRSILLGPIPDSANYLIEINWSKRPTTLAADADTPDLGSEWDEVLKWGTLERVYAGMGMKDEAQYWASLYRDAEWNPIGYCKKLFDAERDREIPAVGKIQFNQL